MTQETRFTPGPWEVAGGSAFRVMHVERGENGELTDCIYICDTANNAKTRTPENAANASLIAAAPEMYELLAAMTKDAEKAVNPVMRMWGYEQAKALLEKAEGKTI